MPTAVHSMSASIGAVPGSATTAVATMRASPVVPAARTAMASGAPAARTLRKKTRSTPSARTRPRASIHDIVGGALPKAAPPTSAVRPASRRS